MKVFAFLHFSSSSGVGRACPSLPRSKPVYYRNNHVSIAPTSLLHKPLKYNHLNINSTMLEGRTHQSTRPVSLAYMSPWDSLLTGAYRVLQEAGITHDDRLSDEPELYTFWNEPGLTDKVGQPWEIISHSYSYMEKSAEVPFQPTSPLAYLEILPAHPSHQGRLKERP